MCTHCLLSLSQGFPPSDHSPSPTPVPSLSFQPQTCRVSQMKKGAWCKVKHGSITTLRDGEQQESKRASSSRMVGRGGLTTGLVQPQSKESWQAILALCKGTALRLASRETHDKKYETGKDWGLSKPQTCVLDHKWSSNLGWKPKGMAVGFGKLPG